MKLSSQNVRKIYLDCLFENEKFFKAEDAITVDGLAGKVTFCKEKVEGHKTEIEEMLMQLPKQFKKSMGGASFLLACNTESGNQWGEHVDMNYLMCLGLSINKVSYLLPREMWRIYPGGMPFIIIDDTEE